MKSITLMVDENKGAALVWVLAVEKLKLSTNAGHRTRIFWSSSMLS